jgi:chemotaxis response regulator CheB
MIRILVVDHYADFRLMCVLMLHRQPELEVVAQAGSPAEAPTML